MTFYVTKKSKLWPVCVIEAKDEWSMFALWDELIPWGWDKETVFYRDPEHGNVRGKTIMKINEEENL